MQWDTDGTDAVESGEVLTFDDIPFELDLRERRFLNPRWSSGREKHISLVDEHVRGAKHPPPDLAVMLMRFRAIAVDLASRLFPRYPASWCIARTSFRPERVEGRRSSWREDDTRLHVDAFPSRPTAGVRLLRVFANVGREPRVWRVGEPFEDVARRFLPRLRGPLPGLSAIAAALRLTRGRRTPYDHLMLALHDAMKRDDTWQREAPQRTVAFAPHTFWICFSDQVPHAVMSGQFALEQTIEVPVDAMDDPARSPLRILERLTGRTLGLSSLDGAAEKERTGAPAR